MTSLVAYSSTMVLRTYLHSASSIQAFISTSLFNQSTRLDCTLSTFLCKYTVEMLNPKAELPKLAGNWKQFSKHDVVHDQLSALKQYLVRNSTMRSYTALKMERLTSQAGNIAADSCAHHLSSTIPKAMTDGTSINDEGDSEDDYDAVYDAVYSIFTTLQHAAIANPQYQASIIMIFHALKRLSPQKIRKTLRI
jgi:hypothetical protein